MPDGYEYRGYWIEDYDHSFDNARVTVWRVQTRRGGAIIKKHLPAEKDAKKWVDEHPRKSTE